MILGCFSLLCLLHSEISPLKGHSSAAHHPRCTYSHRPSPQPVSPLTPYYLDRLHRREAQRGT
nr:MAG TPA: hypothetical protein [Caudoviricetes sp.]